MRTRSLVIALSAAMVGIDGCAAPRPAVRQFGAMRPVMREGRTEARVRLADVARPGAVAVGALEGLAGEITILDGDAWVARVDGDDVRVTGPRPAPGDRATLLTLAHVAHWQSVPIERGAAGPELEELIEREAAAHGMDIAAPFPFVIEGDVEGVDLHVINGYCPIATDPATEDARPWRREGAHPTDVRIVGFFAPDAAGVMTHHGTRIHAHAIVTLDGRTVTAHADRVAVAPGAMLRLPAPE